MPGADPFDFDLDAPQAPDPRDVLATEFGVSRPVPVVSPADLVAAEMQLGDAYGRLRRLDEARARIPRLRYAAIRGVLRSLQYLREVCEGAQYLNSIMRYCGVRESRAYDLDAALEFALRADVIDEPEGWREEHEEIFDESPIPDLSNMAAAEGAFHGDEPHLESLRAGLLGMAREGNLPSKRRIDQMVQGRDPITVQLDCRDRYNDSDIDPQVVNAAVLRAVFGTLGALRRRGSEIAAQQLSALQARLKDVVQRHREGDPEALLEVVVRAKVEFVPRKTRMQEVRERVQAAERADRKPTPRAPSGWYLQKLIEDGDIPKPPQW